MLSFLLAGTLALVIMGFFLSIYGGNRFPVPLGWDTSRYLWRTTLVQGVGFAHMTSAVAPGTRADPGRPAFPVIAATLSSVLGVSTFRVAAVLPSATASAIGLAAGAFVASLLRRSTWEFAVTALLVGTSAFVVRLAGPETYQDNLFATAVFMAAMVPTALSLWDRRALLPAVVLFGVGGVVHWAFFLFMLGTLGLTVLAYLPASLRGWRAGHQELMETPAARLGTVMVGGGALAGATIFGILQQPRTPKLSLSEFARKLRQDIPKYKFWITLPAAAVGAGFLASSARPGKEGRQRARFVLTLLLAWAAVTLAGYVGFKLFHVRVPAHRFLAFALAVPILGAIGLLGVARLVARWAQPVAAGLVVAALAGAAYVSHVAWFRNQTWMDPEKISDATTALAYLDTAHVPTDRPVVFVAAATDSSYAALEAHMIRAAFPAARIGQVYVFIGSPQDYLARRPAPSIKGGVSALSQRYLNNLLHTYDQNPVALVLPSFSPAGFHSWAQARPGSLVAPRVAVVRGPTVATSLEPIEPPLGGLGRLAVGFLGVGCLAILAAMGLGWTLVLLRPWLSPLHLLALSPAVGIAVLVMGGILLDRVGIRLAGAGGIIAAAVITALGWGVLAIGRLRAAGAGASAR